MKKKKGSNQRARFVPERLEVDFRGLEGGGKLRRIKS
jgi:hypothetical protein